MGVRSELAAAVLRYHCVVSAGLGVGNHAREHAAGILGTERGTHRNHTLNDGFDQRGNGRDHAREYP